MSSEQKPFVPKTAMDFQKLKLEKLMANPEKPVVIPEGPKGKKEFSVPEFVRNVMGSSAGAGSGEFHVYRHLRRKEYTRQKIIDQKAETEKLDEEYRNKLEENKRKMEEKTEKNRLKRLKRKQKLKEKQKGAKKKISTQEENVKSSTEDSNDENISDHDSQDLKSKNEIKESSKDDSTSESVKSYLTSKDSDS